MTQAIKNPSLKWRIGCSGFHYKEWKNIFYPPLLPQKNWFGFYAKHFDTLELNNTFYQFPKLASLQKWFNESPDDFIFSLKVPRAITHYKKFVGTEQLLQDFYSVTREGLGAKLGAVLFQLPPQTHYTEQVLDTIIAAVDPSFSNAIEFRHSSWWRKEVYNRLGQNNISFCGSSHPKLPGNIIINNKMVYYRFHGVPDLFHSQYDPDILQQQADFVMAEKAVTDAFFYFNNTAGPAAIANARWLQRYLHVKQL